MSQELMTAIVRGKINEALNILYNHQDGHLARDKTLDLDKQFAPNPEREYKATCLHETCKRGLTEVTEILLHCGASPHVVTSWNATPLHFAATAGHLRDVELLLNKKAGLLLSTSIMGRKPCHHAAAKGHVKIVKLFLDHGFDVNDQDGKGYTALHHAARQGHIKVVKLLVDRGANWHLVDKMGNSALDLAKQGQTCDLITDHIEQTLLLGPTDSLSSVDDPSMETMTSTLVNPSHDRLRCVDYSAQYRGATSKLCSTGEYLTLPGHSSQTISNTLRGNSDNRTLESAENAQYSDMITVYDKLTDLPKDGADKANAAEGSSIISDSAQHHKCLHKLCQSSNDSTDTTETTRPKRAWMTPQLSSMGGIDTIDSCETSFSHIPNTPPPSYRSNSNTCTTSYEIGADQYSQTFASSHSTTREDSQTTLKTGATSFMQSSVLSKQNWSIDDLLKTVKHLTLTQEKQAEKLDRHEKRLQMNEQSTVDILTHLQTHLAHRPQTMDDEDEDSCTGSAQDSDELKQKIQKNLVYLKNNLTADDHTDYLLQENALDWSEVEMIEAENSEVKRVQKMMRILLTKKDVSWAPVFIKALQINSAFTNDIAFKILGTNL